MRRGSPEDVVKLPEVSSCTTGIHLHALHVSDELGEVGLTLIARVAVSIVFDQFEGVTVPTVELGLISKHQVSMQIVVDAHFDSIDFAVRKEARYISAESRFQEPRPQRNSYRAFCSDSGSSLGASMK